MIQSSDNRLISDVISDVIGSSSCVSSENLSLASDQPGRSCLQGERSLQEEGEHHQTDVSLSSLQVEIIFMMENIWLYLIHSFRGCINFQFESTDEVQWFIDISDSTEQQIHVRFTRAAGRLCNKNTFGWIETDKFYISDSPLLTNTFILVICSLLCARNHQTVQNI